MSNNTFPRPFNNDYELLGELGKGGMGSVFKARQIKLNRTVALKVLDRSDEEAEKRFYSEAQAMKELNHQNLATVFDFGTQDNKIFLAMTFVDGEPLSDIIKREKKIPLKTALLIAWQIAKGLEYAHSRDVIHRDIKPSNIMIKPNKEVCIIDFGISLTSETNRLTNTGYTMGTPEYMSPEQCHNKNVTLQSDIYNFGIVLYEMLAGDPPFVGGAALSILNKQLNDPPPPLGKKNSEVTPDVERFVNKCLEKKRENRFANFFEVIEALKAIDYEAPTTKRSTGVVGIKGWTKYERIGFAILGVLQILIIALVILLAFRKTPELQPSINYLDLKSCSVQHVDPEKPCVIQTIHPETGVNQLIDNNLNTAWVVPKASAFNANGGIFLTVQFAKPTLVTHLGLAIGNQNNWANHSKPKDIWVRYKNSSVKEGSVNVQSMRKISLEDKAETQYNHGWIPTEVTTLMFELKTVQNDKIDNDFAISEVRLFGVELGF